MTPNMERISRLNGEILRTNPGIHSPYLWRLFKVRDYLLLREAVCFGLTTREKFQALDWREQKALLQRVYDLPAEYAAWKKRHAFRSLTLITNHQEAAHG